LAECVGEAVVSGASDVGCALFYPFDVGWVQVERGVNDDDVYSHFVDLVDGAVQIFEGVFAVVWDDCNCHVCSEMFKY